MRILIPLYHHFDLLDVCGPSEMFSWAEYTVDLVAEVPGQVTALNGFALSVPNGLPAQAGPYDALWIPGGSPDQLIRIIEDPQQRYLRFITKQAAQCTWVCSVCEGAILLAAAGLLNDYEVTTHWAFIPFMMKTYPKVKMADGYPRFVVDRNRLTGGGISSGLDEALQLITLLSDQALAQEVQQTTQYYPDPPVASSIPHVISTPSMEPQAVSLG
jgi:cyclohexyl-isocyanide hydratase